jgi:hypothetical protein
VDLTQILELTGFGALVALVGYFIVGNRGDRVDYRNALAELRKELKAERAEKELVERQLDDERAARRKAEDEKAASDRSVGALTYENAQVRAENARLRNQLGLP